MGVEWDKLILGSLAFLYGISPIDLIPDFIPGFGWIDDAVIIGVGLGLIVDGLEEESGNPGRPPKKWWNKMEKQIEKDYPQFGEERQRKIVGGIWQNYSESAKKDILRRYD